MTKWAQQFTTLKNLISMTSPKPNNVHKVSTRQKIYSKTYKVLNGEKSSGRLTQSV